MTYLQMIIDWFQTFGLGYCCWRWYSYDHPKHARRDKS